MPPCDALSSSPTNEILSDESAFSVVGLGGKEGLEDSTGAEVKDTSGERRCCDCCLDSVGRTGSCEIGPGCVVMTGTDGF